MAKMTTSRGRLALRLIIEQASAVFMSSLVPMAISLHVVSTPSHRLCSLDLYRAYLLAEHQQIMPAEQVIPTDKLSLDIVICANGSDEEAYQRLCGAMFANGLRQCAC